MQWAKADKVLNFVNVIVTNKQNKEGKPMIISSERFTRHIGFFQKQVKQP